MCNFPDESLVLPLDWQHCQILSRDRLSAPSVTPLSGYGLMEVT